MDVLLDISPKTLSDNLKELESEGLIKRESFAEIPPRVEYTLTTDGKELRDAIIPLLKWVATKKGITERCDPVCQRIPAHICRYAMSEDFNGDMKPQ
ncbi:HxlR-like helix-turn-helix [uncultured archaeon]|nr:HxlR-like helix-turn-helix [uncultured archaeon]